MFEIRRGEHGEVVLIGRLDASRIDEARAFLKTLTTSTTVDLGMLEHIASAGIGVLIETQERLVKTDHKLRFVNMTDRMTRIFKHSGLIELFKID